jgi:hypothetical protein
VFERAEIADARIRVADEDYELLLVPPMIHIRSATLDALERFVAGGGRVLGTLVPPRWALGDDEIEDVSKRVEDLFGERVRGNSTGVGALRQEVGTGATAFVTGDPSVLLQGPGGDRDQLAAAIDDAIRSLIDPDLDLSNPDLFIVHRRREDSDIYFIVNTTFEPQSAVLRLTDSSDSRPVIWDPTSGRQHRAGVHRTDEGFQMISLALPPVGSLFVVTGYVDPGGRGLLEPPEEIEEVTSTRIELGGPWTFTPEDDNALVVKSWRAAPERTGDSANAYAGLEVDDASWQPVVAGAWAYQLPAEPEGPWPVPVWYRIPFAVEHVPERLVLLVDGFDGDDHQVWLNGEALEVAPVRSRIDAQMKELDLLGALRPGRNVLAVRLLLRDETGGLVDHVKLLGSFAVTADDRGDYRLVASGSAAEPAPWTEQGYPFLSGRGAYRCTIDLQPLGGRRALLNVPVIDDVIDVEVNGRAAGVRLWDPYVVDITELVSPGPNEVVVRVANTPANLLNGVARPSGLSGRPILELGPMAGSADAGAVAGETVAPP